VYAIIDAEVIAMATVQTKPEVHYPESDGKPIAESPEHLK
jgi:hypothetical protein